VEGRPMPMPQGVRRRARRRAWVTGGIVLLAVVIVLAGRMPSVQSAACGIPGLRRLVARMESKEVWRQEERLQPLAVRGKLDPFPSEEAAKADTLARAPQEAKDICVGFGQGDFRLLSAKAVPKEWDCRKRPGGYICGFSGEAACGVSVRYRQQMETCP